MASFSWRKIEDVDRVEAIWRGKLLILLARPTGLEPVVTAVKAVEQSPAIQDRMEGVGQKEIGHAKKADVVWQVSIWTDRHGIR
jgi:hypothetical protein